MSATTVLARLMNAYEVEADMVYFAGKIVWSIPERLECLQ